MSHTCGITVWLHNAHKTLYFQLQSEQHSLHEGRQHGHVCLFVCRLKNIALQQPVMFVIRLSVLTCYPEVLWDVQQLKPQQYRHQGQHDGVTSPDLLQKLIKTVMIRRSNWLTTWGKAILHLKPSGPQQA